MAEIFPFRAFRYNPALVDPAKVLTQPYDKITPAMAEKYAAASPYNLIPIEKGKSRAEDTPADNVYTRAANKLEEWIRAKVIVQDKEPSIYAYFQEYTVPGTSERRVRKGFIAVGRIEDYTAGVVFRHEQTLSGPKADRLELLRHTQTHTGQLFMLYSDPAARIDVLLDAAARSKAEVEIRDEYDVVHKMWPVTDTHYSRDDKARDGGQKTRDRRWPPSLRNGAGLPRRVPCARRPHGCKRAIRKSDDVPIQYRRQGTDDPSDAPSRRQCPQFFFRRIPRRAGERIRCAILSVQRQRGAGASLRTVSPRFGQRGQEQRAVGAYAGDGAFYIFVLKKEANLEVLLQGVSPAQRRLDVVLLHRLILERGLNITQDAVKTEKNITYEREMDTAIGEVDSGRAQICFLLNPVSVETVAEMAMCGEVLPQKSTDFFPKLMSGITMYRLKDGM